MDTTEACAPVLVRAGAWEDARGDAGQQRLGVWLRLLTGALALLLAGIPLIATLLWHERAAFPRAPREDAGDWRRPAGVASTRSDIGRDHCADAIVSRDGGLTIRRVAGDTQRFAVGGPGDQVVVGDWDCDGGATAGLYRPRSGWLYLFDDWPRAGRALTSLPGVATGIIDGVISTAAVGDCDWMQVHP